MPSPAPEASGHETDKSVDNISSGTLCLYGVSVLGSWFMYGPEGCKICI